MRQDAFSVSAQEGKARTEGSPGSTRNGRGRFHLGPEYSVLTPSRYLPPPPIRSSPALILDGLSFTHSPGLERDSFGHGSGPQFMQVAFFGKGRTREWGGKV